jgi:cation transport regulator ChaC
LSGSAQISRHARLASEPFIINSDGVATIIKSPGNQVIGVLWDIKKKCEESLDKYEGVKSRIYLKNIMPILRVNGEKADALIYIASNAAFGDPRPGYLEKIIIGAEENHLPHDYIENTLRSWQQR